jgi:hypothetical protein
LVFAPASGRLLAPEIGTRSMMMNGVNGVVWVYPQLRGTLYRPPVGLDHHRTHRKLDARDRRWFGVTRDRIVGNGPRWSGHRRRSPEVLKDPGQTVSRVEFVIEDVVDHCAIAIDELALKTADHHVLEWGWHVWPIELGAPRVWWHGSPQSCRALHKSCPERLPRVPRLRWRSHRARYRPCRLRSRLRRYRLWRLRSHARA